MSSRIRINRFLSTAGLGSRRKCEELVRRGSVFVNGMRIEELSATVDPEKDVVTVDGEKASISGERILLVMNKPAGVMSTAKDTHGRRTVLDIARENGYSKRLFPVGRLDYNTSGILLLTNDGELSYRLMHPAYKIEKTYEVDVKGKISENTVASIASGVDLEDFTTSPCEVRLLERSEMRSRLEITIREGKKRQVRRMFLKHGHRVLALHRKSIGRLSFDDVGAGEIRLLTDEEEKTLLGLTGLE